MSKDEQPSGLPESPLDTAMTIVSPQRDDAVAETPEGERKYATEVTISEPAVSETSGAARPYSTEVTISDPEASAADGEVPDRPTEVTIPRRDSRAFSTASSTCWPETFMLSHSWALTRGIDAEMPALQVFQRPTSMPPLEDEVVSVSGAT